MFLYARIVALSIYSVTLFLIYFLIKKTFNKKKIKKYLIAYVVILSIMGYFYLPYKTADLYGIKYYISNTLSYYNFDHLINILKETKTPMATLYYWIFGQIGNLNLLPAITSAIFYSNVFYILYKSYIKYDWDSRTLAKVLLLFMASGQFLEVISGIRSMLGYSIIALCVFRENILDKRIIKDIPLYFCAILLHDSCLILAIVSIITYVFKSNLKTIVKMLYLILICIISFVLLRENPSYFTFLFEHASRYISGIDEYGRSTYFFMWEYIIAFVCMLFMFYTIIKHSSIKNKTILLNKSYKYIIIIILSLTFVFSFEYSIFERYRSFLMIVSLPLIGNTFYEINNINKNRFQKNKYHTLFLLTVFIIYLIAITRGNLCNLKFFE